jgi:hypothetical protein
LISQSRGLGDVYKRQIWTGAGKAWDNFVKWIGGAVKVIGDIFGAIWTFIGNGFKGFVNLILAGIESWINFLLGGVNLIIKGVNVLLDGIKAASGGTISLHVNELKNVKLPRLAQGGVVYPRSGGVPALLAEAGQPEVVTPLSEFQSMMNNGNGKTIIYNAAPNTSLDAETELLRAMRRAEVIAGW